MPAILFSAKIKVATRKTVIYSTIRQCMKWPVAHSLNSTGFWLELVGNCCERLKITMECTNIQFCERLGHGWQFHPLIRVHFQKFRWQSNVFCITPVSIESLDPYDTVISRICGRILNHFASWVQPYFGVHTPLEEPRNIYQSRALDLLRNCSA